MVLAQVIKNMGLCKKRFKLEKTSILSLSIFVLPKLQTFFHVL